MEETEYKNPQSYILSSPEITISFDGLFDEKLCYQVSNYISSNISDPWHIIILVMKQARTHKKKRINKKWRKKYGYRFFLSMREGWKMRTNTDGSIDFIKD